MNKVDKDAELGAVKQGPRALVSWLSSFTAWDLRQARGELSRWIGPRPWRVSSTCSTIGPLLDLEVSSTSSTTRPQRWICPLRIYNLRGTSDSNHGRHCYYYVQLLLRQKADKIPIQTFTVGLPPHVSVTLTNNGVLGWLAAATI